MLLGFAFFRLLYSALLCSALFGGLRRVTYECPSRRCLAYSCPRPRSAAAATTTASTTPAIHPPIRPSPPTARSLYLHLFANRCTPSTKLPAHRHTRYNTLSLALPPSATTPLPLPPLLATTTPRRHRTEPGPPSPPPQSQAHTLTPSRPCRSSAISAGNNLDRFPVAKRLAATRARRLLLLLPTLDNRHTLRLVSSRPSPTLCPCRCASCTPQPRIALRRLRQLPPPTPISPPPLTARCAVERQIATVNNIGSYTRPDSARRIDGPCRLAPCAGWSARPSPSSVRGSICLTPKQEEERFRQLRQ